LRLPSIARRSLAGALVAASLIASGALAAGGEKREVADEKSPGGKLYDDPKIYANCDLRSLSVKKQGERLIVTAGLRGNQRRFVNTSLNLNTKGAKRSAPELVVDSGGNVFATGGVDADGNYRDYRPKGTAKVSTKARGKRVVFKIGIGKLGGVAKVGVQAQTCGEGAVDIAPGGDYFDDTSFTGKVAHRYLALKLR
jgi:hypothetical protein